MKNVLGLFLKKISIIKSQTGVSLIELATATALAGGVAVMIAKVGKDKESLKKTAEVNTEVNYFMSDVSYILSSKENCNATVGMNAPVNTTVNAIRKVVKSVPITVYETGNDKSYGQNTFSIINMRTSPDGENGINLHIDLQKKTLASTGGKAISKKISLKAVIENGQIISCFSDTDGIIERAGRDACQGNSARWDDINKQCYHDVEDTQCPAGQVLRVISVNSTDRIVRSTCDDVLKTPVTCPQGQYFKSVTPEGVISCAPITLKDTTRCASNQYLRSIANGDLVCETLPSCNPNQILRSNASGTLFSCITINCNPNDQYFAGFDSTGTPICLPVNKNKQCTGVGQYIVSVTPSGAATCGTVPNHANLNQANFYFVDGFSGGSWSVKSDAETAREICNRFSDRTWTGTSCRKLIVNTPVNGGWSNWSGSGVCIAGQTTQVRTCNNPTPQYGGSDCVGSDTQMLPCSMPVDGGWSDWVPGLCIGGITIQSRTCNNPVPSNGGAPCTGSETQTLSCSSPVNGGWSAWGPWSICNGVADRTRSRSCTNPSPENGGANCSGPATETEACPTYKHYRLVTSNSIVSLSNVVPGSLRVWAQGGGGGGGRGNGRNGAGGNAGQIINRTFSSGGNYSCAITIGNAGCGSRPSGCSSSTDGGAGGTTTISCAGESATAAGGAGGPFNGSSCDNGGCGAGFPRNSDTSPRADNIYNSSGHLPSKVIWVNQGGAGGPHSDTGKSPPANTYGGGGGGGSDNGDHSGGPGRPGVVYLEWIER